MLNQNALIATWRKPGEKSGAVELVDVAQVLTQYAEKTEPMLHASAR